MKEIETKFLKTSLERTGRILEELEKDAFQNDAIFDTTAAALTKAQDDFSAARARCEMDDERKAETRMRQNVIYRELKARKQTE